MGNATPRVASEGSASRAHTTRDPAEDIRGPKVACEIVGALRRSVLFLLLIFLAMPNGASAADRAVSLEEALREARTANARLPLPALDISIAREKRTEARAERWLKVAADGDFVYAPPGSYDPIVTNLGDSRLQLGARQPLFDGGARRAAVSRAEADLDLAGARYRIVERDLDLEVRSRFAELLQARGEIEVRREGLERLRTYQTSLKSRQAAGQGIGADILKTGVRIALEESNLLEGERRLDQARLLLNELMGRDPAAPLSVVPTPPPQPRLPDPEDGWASGPDVAAAEVEIRSAGAAVALARSEQKPHLFLSADIGFWGSDTSRLVPLDVKADKPDATFADRVLRDAGYSFGLVFSWPLWDHGAARARVAQAELGLERAKRNLDLQTRGARLQWEQARSTLRNLARQIEILSRSAPEARDAYLDAESRYRGGSASALEVFDSYAAAVDASVRLTEATARYRIARALEARWGTP